MELRDYQREAVDSIYAYFGKHDGNCLVSASTGSGKSVIIAAFCSEVTQQWPDQKILMLTHVKELLDQNEKAMKRYWPNIDVGVYSAGLKRKELGHSITVAGIQSIYKKADLLGHIDLVLVDECHLLSPNQDTMYQSLLTKLKEVNPKLKMIGFSATPYRTKGGCLTNSKLFDDVCYEIGVKELVERGYLTELVSKWGLTQADLKGVAKLGGEYNIKQMSERFTDALTASALKDCIKFGADRKKWMVFCTSVEHTEKVAKALNDAGIPATFVTGKTTSDEREKRLKDFSAGKYRALVNCGVLTTGYDEPAIDLIVLLRATQSPGLYVQICGRGMRLHEGKKNCLVLDFGENISRHGPIDMIKVAGPKSKSGIIVTPMKACENLDCRASCFVQAKTCHECGFEFQFNEGKKHDALAAGGALLSGQEKEPEWITVSNVSYAIHTKRSNGSRTLKVRYITGMLSSVEEYWCFEHKGYARRKAIEWYREVSGEKEVPTGLEEVLKYCLKLKKPARVLVKLDGKHERVIGYEY